MNVNGYRWFYKGRWRKTLPLPWHTRLRLRYTRCIDGAAYWLVCHDHPDAARHLYQLTGLWNESDKP
jgi:hypothetical protein